MGNLFIQDWFCSFEKFKNKKYGINFNNYYFNNSTNISQLYLNHESLQLIDNFDEFEL